MGSEREEKLRLARQKQNPHDSDDITLPNTFSQAPPPNTSSAIAPVSAVTTNAYISTADSVIATEQKTSPPLVGHSSYSSIPKQQQPMNFFFGTPSQQPGLVTISPPHTSSFQMTSIPLESTTGFVGFSTLDHLAVPEIEHLPIDSPGMETIALSSSASEENLHINASGFTQPSFNFNYSKSSKRSKYPMSGVAGFGTSETQPTSERTAKQYGTPYMTADAFVSQMQPIYPPLVASNQAPLDLPLANASNMAASSSGVPPPIQSVWSQQGHSSEFQTSYTPSHVSPTQKIQSSPFSDYAYPSQQPSLSNETTSLFTHSSTESGEILNNNYAPVSVGPGVGGLVDTMFQSTSPIPFACSASEYDPFAMITGNIPDDSHARSISSTVYIDRQVGQSTTSPKEVMQQRSPPLQSLETGHAGSTGPFSARSTTSPSVAILPVYSLPDASLFSHDAQFTEINEQQYEMMQYPKRQGGGGEPQQSHQTQEYVDGLQRALDEVSGENLKLRDAQRISHNHQRDTDSVLTEIQRANVLLVEQKHLLQQELDERNKAEAEAEVEAARVALEALSPTHLHQNRVDGGVSLGGHEADLEDREHAGRAGAQREEASLKRDRHDLDAAVARHQAMAEEARLESEARHSALVEKEHALDVMTRACQQKLDDVDEVSQMRAAEASELIRVAHERVEQREAELEDARAAVEAEHRYLEDAREAVEAERQQLVETLASHEFQVAREEERLAAIANDLHLRDQAVLQRECPDPLGAQQKAGEAVMSCMGCQEREQLDEYQAKYDMMAQKEATILGLKEELEGVQKQVTEGLESFEVSRKEVQDAQVDLYARRLQLEAAEAQMEEQQQKLQDQTVKAESELQRLAALETSLHAAFESKQEQLLVEMSSEICINRARGHSDISRTAAGIYRCSACQGTGDMAAVPIQAVTAEDGSDMDSKAELEQMKLERLQLAEERALLKDREDALKKKSNDQEAQRFLFVKGLADLESQRAKVSDGRNRLDTERLVFEDEVRRAKFLAKREASRATKADLQQQASMTVQLKASLARIEQLERMLVERDEALYRAERDRTVMPLSMARRLSLSSSSSSPVDERVHFLETKVNCVMEAEEDMRVLLQRNMEEMEKLKRQINPDMAVDHAPPPSIPSMSTRLSRTEMRSAYGGSVISARGSGSHPSKNSVGILQAVADYSTSNSEINSRISRIQSTTQQGDASQAKRGYYRPPSVSSMRRYSQHDHGGGHSTTSEAPIYSQGYSRMTSATTLREPMLSHKHMSYDGLSQRYQNQSHSRVELQPAPSSSSYSRRLSARGPTGASLEDLRFYNNETNNNSSNAARGSSERSTTVRAALEKYKESRHLSRGSGSGSTAAAAAPSNGTILMQRSATLISKEAGGSYIPSYLERRASSSSVGRATPDASRNRYTNIGAPHRQETMPHPLNTLPPLAPYYRNESGSSIMGGDKSVQSPVPQERPGEFRQPTIRPYPKALYTQEKQQQVSSTLPDSAPDSAVKGLYTYFSSTDMAGFSESTKRILRRSSNASTSAIGRPGQSPTSTHIGVTTTTKNSSGNAASNSSSIQVATKVDPGGFNTSDTNPNRPGEDIREKVRRRLEESSSAKAAALLDKPPDPSRRLWK
ncbi:hypothetical protein BSLG_002346 [Batrachochytrium salamandrivorans]|nr:hypothetical protein BSLG_002346 [Batrachochytrium salamandrivorans]